MKQIPALFFLVFLAAAPAPDARADAQAPLPPAPGVARPRTWLLSYDPILESQGGARLHVYAHWNDPSPLTGQYLADLEGASHGWLASRLTRDIVIDAYPLKEDGFRYTDDSYLNGLQGGGWHAPDGVDYKAIVRDFDLARRTDRGEIDEVVVHGAPYFGYYESRMAGRGGYWCNSPPQPRIACTKIFVMMGLNYERGVAEEIHSYGHRSESILAHTYGSWDITQSRHDWERFTHNIGQSPDAACGSVHYPPNGMSDYDYANPTLVVSTAIDWELNFPNLNGQTSMVNRDNWGGPDWQRNYLRWWYSHMPHLEGSNSHDGLTRWNSWWPYIADFNHWTESGGSQPLGGPAPPASPLGLIDVIVPGPTADQWGPRSVPGTGAVVWYGSDGHDTEIYFYDVDYGGPITDNEFDDEAPAIAGYRVVWQGFDGQDYEIFSADFTGDNRVQITDNSTNDWHPQINASGRIVWEGFDGTDAEIYTANADGTGLTRITDNSSPTGYPRDDLWPQINDTGRVAWFGWDGADWEVFSANSDGTGLVNLSDNTYEDEYPMINATGRVVWHSWLNNANTEIWSSRCTGGGAVRITNNSYPDFYPQINGSGRIVWTALNTASDWEVMAADSTGGNLTAITNNLSQDQYPEIDDQGRIAWQGLDGNDWEIYLWREGTIYQVTNSQADDRGVSIRSGHMVWSADDGGPGPALYSQIHQLDLNGVGAVDGLSATAGVELSARWSHPGDVLLVYAIPRATEVSLIVVDAAGRERARLASGPSAAGRHEMRWNGAGTGGRGLPAGVYFARLSAGGEVRSARVVLTR